MGCSPVAGVPGPVGFGPAGPTAVGTGEFWFPAGLAGLAATLLISGSLGPAGFPQQWWCPGLPIPRGVTWDMFSCHEFHYEIEPDGTRIAVLGPPATCGATPCG